MMSKTYSPRRVNKMSKALTRIGLQCGIVAALFSGTAVNGTAVVAMAQTANESKPEPASDLSVTEQSVTEQNGADINANTPDLKQLGYEREFAKYLTGSKLVGLFTVDGKPLGNLEPEAYEIRSAKRVEGTEKEWEIKTRIQYGEKDFDFDVILDIEWIGKTPIMVLDNVTIPGMGTFSARVLFHDKKYAGTWKHDKRGGHLMGRVEK